MFLVYIMRYDLFLRYLGSFANHVRTKVQVSITNKPSLSLSDRKNELNATNKPLDDLEHLMHFPIHDLCSRAEAYQESPELLASVCT
jgi:hypothetical protein